MTTEKLTTASPTRKRDLLLAFVTVSLPLLAIASILLGFVFSPSKRIKLDSALDTTNAPESDGVKIPSAYYTMISPGSFLLLATWASNFAAIVIAPFMVLFSYAVAREGLQYSLSRNEADLTSEYEHPPLLREMMRGANSMFNLSLRRLEHSSRTTTTARASRQKGNPADNPFR